MTDAYTDYITGFKYFSGEIILFGILFFYLERLRPAEKDVPFFKKDFYNELLLAITNIGLFQPLFTVSIILAITSFLSYITPYQMFAETITSMPIALQIALAMLAMDFSVYWRHRFSHFYMWSFHSVHHSAEHLTWITSLRLHPVDVLAAMIFDTVILHFVGFEGAGILGALVLLKIMNYMTHVNMDLQFSKPLRYILASPNYHRWHHATVKEAYDKNFCGAFPFLDALFGTYYHPEGLPPRYGLSAVEQKNFPSESFGGWLLYPFRREWKRWKKKTTKN